jgi:para-aminobenzoate synthetase component I
MAFKQFALPYFHDSAHLFACIRDRHWPIFLDSGQAVNPSTGMPGSHFGRYDILVADPVITFVTQGDITTIAKEGKIERSRQDPFALLKQYLTPQVAKKPNFLLLAVHSGILATILGAASSTFQRWLIQAQICQK